jgi:hypothetical protein
VARFEQGLVSERVGQSERAYDRTPRLDLELARVLTTDLLTTLTASSGSTAVTLRSARSRAAMRRIRSRREARCLAWQNATIARKRLGATALPASPSGRRPRPRQECPAVPGGITVTLGAGLPRRPHSSVGLRERRGAGMECAALASGIV